MRTTIVTMVTGCSSAAGLALLLVGTSPVRAQTCGPVQDCGDVNASGAVDTSDALQVLRKAVGQSEDLTCECSAGDSVCGNGVIEGGEDCEVGVSLGQTCLGLGYEAGTLDCSPGCAFETTGCFVERFVNRYDGTVLDLKTGLQWETKASPGGGAADPHDVDNDYSWTGAPGGTSGDGTVFTDFLAELNNDCTVTGPYNTLSGSFVKYCDWRIPRIEELKSILLEPSPCETKPCIDPIFGPIDMSKPYWTATTIGDEPTSAMVIAFGDGSQSDSPKDQLAHVIAVRGLMRLGILAAGSFGCPTPGGTKSCPTDYVCMDAPGDDPTDFNDCVKRCIAGGIGTQGSCPSGYLCMDVDPGVVVTTGCVAN